MFRIIGKSAIILILMITSVYPFQPLFDTHLDYQMMGLHISSSVKADFNNDGYIDIICASNSLYDGSYYNQLKYFVNNGDGTFQAPLDIHAGVNNTAMLPGDFNSDGWKDFVTVSNWPNDYNFHINVFMNDGNGNLVFDQVFSNFSVPYIAVMDLNNDGFDDILQMDSNNLNILFSNDDGTFTFGASGEGMIPVPLDHFGQMRPWDVNNDDFPDLLIQGKKTVTPSVGDAYSQSFIATYINNADTTFTLAAEFLYGSSSDQLIASTNPGYFNSDSYEDLLIIDNQDVLTILTGNGDGSFSLHESVGVTTAFPTTHGDVNGDGLADILISDSENASISVLLNNGDAGITFADPIEYSGKWNAKVSSPRIGTEDFNNDGYDDIVLTSFYNFSTIINRGDGSFPILKTIENMGTEAFDILTADFNKDGSADIMTIDGGKLYLSYNDGTGNFLPSETILSDLDWQNGIFSGDFNADEIPDFAVTKGLKLFYGLEEGGFQPGPDYGDSLVGLSAIDGKSAYLNDDEFIDFALYYFGSLRIVLSDSEGSYNLESYVFSTDGFSKISDIDIIDIDQDDDMDILFGFLDGVYINYNDGQGGFHTSDILTSGGAANSLILEDLNSDGFVDIAATHNSDVGVYLNNGDGSFATVVKYGYLSSIGYHNLSSADMDGDGDADLVTTISKTHEIAVFLNEGNGTFHQIQYYTGGDDPKALVLADFDNDSTMDVAVTSSVPGRDFVYLFMNGGYSYASIEATDSEGTLPNSMTLFQNYPNPFNPTTTISYQLPARSAGGSAVSQVDLSIYNVLGQKVATLVSGQQQAGQYQVRWDASEFSSGLYFYQLKTGKQSEVHKMMLIR